MMRSYLKILPFLLSFGIFAQNNLEDSLQNVLKTAKEDTNKVKTLILLSKHFNRSGNYDSSLKKGEIALQLATKLKFKRGIATSLTALGNAHFNKGNYSGSLKGHLASLKIREELGDKNGISDAYGNIANVHLRQSNFKEALTYYLKVLQIKKEIGDKYGCAAAYSGIANIYSYQNLPDSALKYCYSALDIFKELNDVHAMAYMYNNIGAACDIVNKDEEALKSYLAAAKIQEEIGNEHGLATSLNNVSNIYLQKKNYPACEKYALKSLSLAISTGALFTKREAYSILYSLYKAQGKHKQALDNYNNYIACRDSLINEEKTKEIIQLEMKYDFDKKAAVDSVNHAKEKLVQAAELKKQEAEIKVKKNQQYVLFGGIGLVLIFAGFMYNRFKITQKQKGVIELQKTEVEHQTLLVEEKQKEIVDSINYAKRIQRAHLPTEKYLAKNLERLKKI